MTGSAGTDSVAVFGYINVLKDCDASVQWTLFMPGLVSYQQQDSGIRVQHFEYKILPALRLIGAEKGWTSRTGTASGGAFSRRTRLFPTALNMWILSRKTTTNRGSPIFRSLPLPDSRETLIPCCARRDLTAMRCTISRATSFSGRMYAFPIRTSTGRRKCTSTDSAAKAPRICSVWKNKPDHRSFNIQTNYDIMVS